MTKRHDDAAGKDNAEEVDFSAVDAEPQEQETVIEARVVRERTGLPRIALVMALLAFAGGGIGLVVGYQQLRGVRDALARMDQVVRQAGERQGRLAAQLQRMEQQLAEQKRQGEARNQALADQQKELRQERDRLRLQAEEVRSALDSVHQRIGRSSTQWMAAEAGYLMQVANNRLRLAADVDTAIAALQAADARLRDTGDPSWVGVREILAAEIARLKGVGRLDLAGLSARLSGLAAQVESLKLAGTEPAAAEPAQQAPAAPREERERSWKSLLEDGWEGFKSIMVIRHHGRPVQAMLPPEQQYFVYQNLRLQLEAARTALLQRDQTLYDTSLETARQWLDEFFDPDDGDTRSMKQAIDGLRKVQVRPPLPDISRSLVALQERLKQLGSQSGGGA